MTELSRSRPSVSRGREAAIVLEGGRPARADSPAPRLVSAVGRHRRVAGIVEAESIEGRDILMAYAAL